MAWWWLSVYIYNIVNMNSVVTVIVITKKDMGDGVCLRIIIVVNFYSYNLSSDFSV